MRIIYHENLSEQQATGLFYTRKVKYQCVPDTMFSELTLTNESLSGLLCSCQRPRAWKIS